MFQRNQLQALSGLMYPVVPAGWPNRAVRRAVKQNRESRLPQCWKQALVAMPKLRAAIKVL
jgi:hypothetical protein